MAPPVSPFTFFALPTITTAEQQLRCARQWVDRSLQAISGPARCLARNRASGPKPKTTLGYLSADFHSHATAYLIAELFEKHDRQRFQVFGYSCGADDGSPMRRRLIKAFDRFSDLKDASFVESAQRIAADGVDILVDLKGYTQNARTQILALRPAPVQVNYLGYPGTMGAPFMDYILVDDFVVPGDQQPFFTEKLVHLPGCYQVNDSQREISAHAPSRAECGLPEKGFVFCSFNNSYKITPDVFDVWMGLLKAVSGSVFWLFEGNRFAPANLRREAEARGVAAQRLVFAPRKPPPEHLARHRVADLFLDTFPVNAHTTASDALWAGCPVLTMAGETFVSRVAGSLLRTIGLSELVTTSLDDYQAMALRLARDAESLAGLRARLEASRRNSPLFDAGQFARNLEKAYIIMWEIYACGQQPHAFTVSATLR
jgi:predicted O-linked N-acetylglucosamine transferase (SPINDLY family)